MNTSKKLTVTTALALTLSLGLTACGDDEPDVETPADEPAATAPAETGSDDADDTADDTTATDDAGASTPGDAADDTSDDANPTDDAGASSPGDDAAGDLTAVALVAIGTAEAEAGGTAYEIDDQDDDGTWEVDVRVDDRSVEVTVSEDGTQVVETEDDDLDDEDRAALDASTITLAEAIELAVAEAGGVLDDAELEGEDDGQPHHWEVSVDTDEQDDIEVLVGVDGEILGTDG
ncbi:hypothetical protein NF556_14935 [Ornithinimicrobium faecis]|uniref:PepSY domain-containing protein n=1 Tax=Ornithinimicrobium faecis TaxID=2934158 RepID=A0ABY4YRV9_9MICO|nr:hypothetical protein [Ornithinimicrobium sp. HY1793]USQ78912.1 hypothetical protein NF556_14935 [Ornithinimicrobium sp. HY1793]